MLGRLYVRILVECLRGKSPQKRWNLGTIFSERIKCQQLPELVFVQNDLIIIGKQICNCKAFVLKFLYNVNYVMFAGICTKSLCLYLIIL